MLRPSIAFAFLVLIGAADAMAQACVQDRSGRVVCGNQVGPYYGPGPSPYYGPSVDRIYGGQVPQVIDGRRRVDPAGRRVQNGVRVR